MDGTANRTRGARVLAFAAALMLPASASVRADDGVRQATPAFASSFADIAAPAAHQPVEGAVDVTAIDPADEAAPGLGDGDWDSLGGGIASYYADKFNGRRTASGETFSNGAMTAAHRSLPFGSKVRVTNPANGRSVVVRINDRGPFHGNRLIDLSKSAASTLGIVQRGSGRVELALLD